MKLRDKVAQAASDMGFDAPTDMTEMLAEHGLVIVLASELDAVNDLVLKASEQGAQNPSPTHESRTLMYDLNAYLARNGLGKWKR